MTISFKRWFLRSLLILAVLNSGCVTQLAYEVVKGAHPVEIKVKADQEQTEIAIKKAVESFGYSFEPGEGSACYGLAKSSSKDWHIYYECSQFQDRAETQVTLWRAKMNKSPLTLYEGRYEFMNPDLELEIRKVLFAIKKEAESPS